MLNSCRRVLLKTLHRMEGNGLPMCCHHLKPYSSSRYEEAVKTLNTLQSNADVLEKLRKERDTLLIRNIKNVEECLNKVGVKIEDLDKLKVIHISGTKGKGSTSAFCESILRHTGCRTGFYSSPHLVEVRERIRIDGQPISQKLFTSYFWDVHSALWKQRSDDDDMPGYFKFLTIMAYYIFLKEKVDVAIIEVGIGGEYDSTNVVRSPIVCGVTSLGLDHVNILGDTIAKIAWSKAGIFKPGVPAFTAPQPKEGLQVLLQRAQEIGNPLYVVPDLEAYEWGNKAVTLGLAGHVQYINASLAIQLATAWIDINNGRFKFRMDEDKRKLKNTSLSGHTNFAKGFPLNESIVKGLENCYWPGRNHILRQKSAVYFLDGAHTEDSIKACKQWFCESSKKEELKNSGSVFRILVFNVVGQRDIASLLSPFIDSNLDTVVFCPNFVHISHHDASDQNAVASPWNTQMERCNSYNYLWKNLQQNRLEEKIKDNNFVNGDKKNGKKDIDVLLQDKRSSNIPQFIPSVVFPCICDVLKWISERNELKQTSNGYSELPAMMHNFLKADNIHVLISGSLHLVGGFLSNLQPDAIETNVSNQSILKTI